MTASRWSGPVAFIAVTGGAVVGLGNLWSLPQFVLSQGGGAFLLVYLIGLVLGALPILLAEMALGRRGGGAPPRALQAAATNLRAARLWGAAGWLAVVAATIVLAYFSVVAGWLLAYLARALGGALVNVTPQGAVSIFSALVTDPERSLAWHTLATLGVVAVAARPLRVGLQPVAGCSLVLLLLALLALTLHAARGDGFMQFAGELFTADFSRLSLFGVWNAARLSFFSLMAGLGVATVLAAYLPPASSLPRLALGVVAIDVIATLLALLALTPPILEAGLVPDGGSRLVFERALVALSALPDAHMMTTLLFVTACLIALGSMLGLAEVLVASITSVSGSSRRRAAAIAGTIWWLLGVAALLSFNLWSEQRILGQRVYELLEFMSSHLLMPISALLILLHGAWVLGRTPEAATVGMGRLGFTCWRATARYLAPLLAGLVLLISSGLVAEVERLLL